MRFAKRPGRAGSATVAEEAQEAMYDENFESSSRETSEECAISRRNSPIRGGRAAVVEKRSVAR